MESKLKTLRKAAGLTQAELSTQAGMATSKVARIESGQISINNVTLSTAVNLARVLGVKADDLFEEEE